MRGVLHGPVMFTSQEDWLCAKVRVSCNIYSEIWIFDFQHVLGKSSTPVMNTSQCVPSESEANDLGSEERTRCLAGGENRDILSRSHFPPSTNLVC